MKKLILLFAAGVLLVTSCDKVEGTYPASPPVTENEGDYSDYPGGDSLDYWNTDGPVFVANQNTQRNVLIEDFTGHKCNNCPPAAEVADNIHNLYPYRVFIAAIHAGPNGLGGNQAISTDYPTDWTNQDGIDIGFHFGNLPSAQFIGNPSGTVNRIPVNGQHTQSAAQWQNNSEVAMQTPLQVNIQSAANYYSSTRGMFLHTEIEVVDPSISDDLYTVVYLIEDSKIGMQTMPDNTSNPFYEHKDVMRGCVLSDWQGIELSSANEVEPNKYRYDYIFELEGQYAPENMHLLIYVRNAVTEEVYHVVKQKFID
jgi:hypothetical protein